MTPKEADASHMNLLYGENVPLGSRRDTFNVNIFSCICVGASRSVREGRGQCVDVSLKEKCDVATNVSGWRHVVVERHKELQRTHQDRECPGRSQCGRCQHYC